MTTSTSDTEAKPKAKRGGRPRRSDDQKAVLKKTREFLDSPTNPDRLNALVSAIITYEIKARIQGK